MNLRNYPELSFKGGKSFVVVIVKPLNHDE